MGAVRVIRVDQGGEGPAPGGVGFPGGCRDRFGLGRHLQHGGGQRAAVPVVGILQPAGQERPVGAQRGGGRAVVPLQGSQRVGNPVTGVADGFRAQRFLAAGEIVVERALGGRGEAQDVIDAGGRVAALAEQLGGGVHQAVAVFGAGSHGRRLRIGHSVDQSRWKFPALHDPSFTRTLPLVTKAIRVFVRLYWQGGGGR